MKFLSKLLQDTIRTPSRHHQNITKTTSGHMKLLTKHHPGITKICEISPKTSSKPHQNYFRIPFGHHLDITKTTSGHMKLLTKPHHDIIRTSSKLLPKYVKLISKLLQDHIRTSLKHAKLLPKSMESSGNERKILWNLMDLEESTRSQREPFFLDFSSLILLD